MTSPSLLLRPTVRASTYVLFVAATAAAAGFTTGSAAPILLAALFALPTSILAMPGYYVAYGVLALVPGANPSSSSGSMSCAPDGSCQGFVTGEQAAWFTVTTDVLGILALTAAAVLNVLLVRTGMVASRRRPRHSRATFG